MRSPPISVVFMNSAIVLISVLLQIANRRRPRFDHSWRRCRHLCARHPPHIRSQETPDDYRRIPLLTFFSRKATSKDGNCPLLRWMTETKSECCVLAVLMPLTITSVTL